MLSTTISALREITFGCSGPTSRRITRRRGETPSTTTTHGCEQVRRYVVNNALYWIREYHLDGLRLDAVQTIKDDSPKHILAEIQENVQPLARPS